MIGGSKSAHAENDTYNLKNAISAYFTEYRKYPDPREPEDRTFSTNHGLMDILLGSEKEKGVGKGNPRMIGFFVGKQAKPMEGARFRKGINLDEHGGGTFWDPYGVQYKVRVDSNRDNRVETPESPGTYLPESILVWCAGPDGNFETWDDNIKTW